MSKTKRYDNNLRGGLWWASGPDAPNPKRPAFTGTVEIDGKRYRAALFNNRRRGDNPDAPYYDIVLSLPKE